MKDDRDEFAAGSAFLSRPFLGEGFHVGRALDDASTPVERPLPEGLHAFTLGPALGSGTFATVYSAEQQTPVRRRVAIKVLHAELDQRSAAQRFRREWQALARLEHPGIARLYEAGMTADNRLYLSMEFVDGEPIDTGAARHRLSIAERVRLVRDACRAVHHAHIKGIVHRDLKPANILLAAIAGGCDDTRDAASDGEPTFAVKVIDFGMAKAIVTPVDDSSLRTIAGQLVGTVPYMAPEQLEGRVDDVDIRTDVYAMGVVLYELIAERRPHSFARLGPLEAARIVRDERPPSLRSLVPSVSLDLDRVVAMALSVEPRGRYQSMAEFAADLDRVLTDAPVMARTPTAIEGLARWTRRHPLPASMGVALLGLLVVAAGLGWSLARSAEHRLADARGTVQGYLKAVVRMEQLSGAAEIRRELLQDASQIADGLAHDAPDDLDALRTQADVLVVLSALERETAPSGLSNARALRARARDIRERILVSGVATDADKRAHATCLILCGDIEKEENRIEEARTFYEAALVEHRELSQRDPDDLESARHAVFGLERLGDLAQTERRDDVAAEYFRRQLVEAERLRADHPTIEELRWDVCVARKHAIMAATGPGDFDRAEELVDASMLDAAALLALDPSSRPYAELLGDCHLLKARVLTFGGRPAEALPFVEKGRDIFERLAKDNPLQVALATGLHSALVTHAVILEAIGGEANRETARVLADRAERVLQSLVAARPFSDDNKHRRSSMKALDERLGGAGE